MSFAVFGVSKELAQTQAAKRLKAIEIAGAESAKKTVESWKFDRKLSKVDVAIKILSSIEEIPQEAYQNALTELISFYMGKLAPKQISPLYGDPKRCSEFIDLAKRYGVNKIISKQCTREPDPKRPGYFKSKWNDVPAHLMR
jgi:hypothetical protein